MGGKDVEVSLNEGSAELSASADIQSDEIPKAVEESGYRTRSQKSKGSKDMTIRSKPEMITQAESSVLWKCRSMTSLEEKGFVDKCLLIAHGQRDTTEEREKQEANDENGAKLAHGIGGKTPETVVYSGYCPLCSSRIDEFGLCDCGTGGN